MVQSRDWRLEISSLKSKNMKTQPLWTEEEKVQVSFKRMEEVFARYRS